MPSVFVVLVSVWLTGCVAGVLPPSRTDIGTAMEQGASGEVRTGVRASTGMHWASATLNEEEAYDVGVGYVYEQLEAAGGDISQPSSQHASDSVNRQGAYISAAHLLSNNPKENYRTWLGVRAEYLHAAEDDGGATFGVLARGTWEIFGAGQGSGGFSDSCGGAAGFAYGTTAIGLYLEGGARRNGESEASFVATAGVSMRLPLLGGFAFNLCGN